MWQAPCDDDRELSTMSLLVKMPLTSGASSLGVPPSNPRLAHDSALSDRLAIVRFRYTSEGLASARSVFRQE